MHHSSKYNAYKQWHKVRIQDVRAEGIPLLPSYGGCKLQKALNYIDAHVPSFGNIKAGILCN